MVICFVLEVGDYTQNNNLSQKEGQKESNNVALYMDWNEFDSGSPCNAKLVGDFTLALTF